MTSSSLTPSSWSSRRSPPTARNWSSQGWIIGSKSVLVWSRGALILLCQPVVLVPLIHARVPDLAVVELGELGGELPAKRWNAT
jgi:hypothetical protein